jgi:hypothetical protein
MTLKILAVCLALMIMSGTSAAGEAAPPFAPGERIVYTIKKLALNVGEMTLAYSGPVTKDGRECLLLELSVRALNFTGDDKIYLDPLSFYPLRVERDLVFFGKKELIAEDYDPGAGTVKVTKTAGGETTVQTIRKEGALENIYGFIYRYRASGRLDENQELKIRLPTQDVTMTYRGPRPVHSLGGKQVAYYLESSPPAYRIWLDTSPRKVPLRIDGAAGFGSTVMLLKEYQP